MNRLMAIGLRVVAAACLASTVLISAAELAKISWIVWLIAGTTWLGGAVLGGVVRQGRGFGTRIYPRLGPRLHLLWVADVLIAFAALAFIAALAQTDRQAEAWLGLFLGSLFAALVFGRYTWLTITAERAPESEESST
jgi:hypothetical protein